MPAVRSNRSGSSCSVSWLGVMCSTFSAQDLPAGIVTVASSPEMKSSSSNSTPPNASATSVSDDRLTGLPSSPSMVTVAVRACVPPGFGDVEMRGRGAAGVPRILDPQTHTGDGVVVLDTCPGIVNISRRGVARAGHNRDIDFAVRLVLVVVDGGDAQRGGRRPLRERHRLRALGRRREEIGAGGRRVGHGQVDRQPACGRPRPAGCWRFRQAAAFETQSSSPHPHCQASLR